MMLSFLNSTICDTMCQHSYNDKANKFASQIKLCASTFTLITFYFKKLEIQHRIVLPLDLYYDFIIFYLFAQQQRRVAAQRFTKLQKSIQKIYRVHRLFFFNPFLIILCLLIIIRLLIKYHDYTASPI